MRTLLDRLLPLNELRLLRFQEPRETQFQAFYVAAFAKQSSHYLLFGLLVFLSFAISDWLLLSQSFWPVLTIRLGIGFLLIIMLGILLCIQRRYPQRNFMLMESIGLVINNAAIVYIGLLAAKDGVPEYQTGTLLIILFAATLSRLTFRYCALTILLSILTYSLLLFSPEATSSIRFTINNWTLCVATAIISLINSYQREYESRRDFLTTTLLEEQHQQLTQTQTRLTWLAEHDALTGLYNRRYFDVEFKRQCMLCSNGGESLALLLIDVDHFKRYNDGFGHLAGDECLQKLATVFEAHARRKDDFAARIGGEEFCLVLPRMSLNDANRLAEQLLIQINALAIKHPNGNWVSVSIGLAARNTACPWTKHEPEQLRILADQALYQAKAEGRGCVVSGGALPTASPSRTI